DEADRALVEHSEKTRRSAAMLDVWLPTRARRTQEDARLICDERGEIRRDAGFPTAPPFHGRVAATGSLAALDRLDVLRERDVAGVPVGAAHVRATFRARKPRMRGTISPAFSSSARWPVSSRWSSASGRSRRYG